MWLMGPGRVKSTVVASLISGLLVTTTAEFMEQMQKEGFVSINTNITGKEFEEQLERGIEDGQGNIICKSPEDNWMSINRFCDGIPYCNCQDLTYSSAAHMSQCNKTQIRSTTLR